jgi:hypothetical protein
MNQRWQTGLSPFDGDCLVVIDDVLSVEDLRSLLAVVVRELKGQYDAQALYTFDDWHQHDGYVTERRAMDWRELEAVSQTGDALIASRQGDTYVHRSFYPEDFAFFLRYDVPDEDSGDGSGFAGTFDVSASSTMIARLTALVPVGLGPRVRIERSKSYFDRTYAG